MNACCIGACHSSARYIDTSCVGAHHAATRREEGGHDDTVG